MIYCVCMAGKIGSGGAGSDLMLAALLGERCRLCNIYSAICIFNSRNIHGTIYIHIHTHIIIYIIRHTLT